MVPWTLAGFVCFGFLFSLRHLDFFEMVRNEDDLELAKRFDLVSFSLEYLNLPNLNINFGCLVQLPFVFPENNDWLGCWEWLVLVFTVSHLASRVSVMCEQWKQWSQTGLLPSVFDKDFFLLFGWRFRSGGGSQTCSHVLSPDDPDTFQFQTFCLQDYGWSLSSSLMLFSRLQETLLKIVTSQPVEGISILYWVDFRWAYSKDSFHNL